MRPSERPTVSISDNPAAREQYQIETRPDGSGLVRLSAPYRSDGPKVYDCPCCAKRGFPKNIERDYIFRDPDGREVFKKRRFKLDPEFHNGRTKTFRYMYIPDPLHRPYCYTFAKPPGADQWLYRYGSWERGEPVFWTEGEKDADNVAALGVAATSHHQAAGNATAEQAMSVARSGVSEIVLIGDRDAPGYFDLLRRATLLRDAGVRSPVYIGVPPEPYKDVSDLLEAGGSLDDLTELGEPEWEAAAEYAATRSVGGYDYCGEA